MSNYIALIHKDPDSDYSVSFPDFPGFVTAGATIDDAKAMAAEALAFHVAGMIEDGDGIPAPSDLETVIQDREHREAVAFLVPLPEPKPAKVVPVDITIAEDILAQIDRYAAAHGFTRSGFMTRAARREMETA